MQCLKALDIHEANLTGAASLDPLPLNPPVSSQNPAQSQINPLSLCDIGSLNPEVVVSGGGLNQARRLIDDAVAVFVSEGYLFSKRLILVDWDFYLATAVLLEKVSIALFLQLIIMICLCIPRRQHVA